MRRYVAMGALMQRVEAQEVGARCSRGSGSFIGPRERRAIIGSHPQGLFGHGVASGQDVLVSNQGHQLQVRDRDGAMWLGDSDERALHSRVKRLAPQEGWVYAVWQGVKPYAAHTVNTSIACTDVRRGCRYEFLESCRARL